MALRTAIIPRRWIRHALTRTPREDGSASSWTRSGLAPLPRLQAIRVSDRELAQFARGLAVMYDAGIPFVRAVEMLSRQTESLDWALLISWIHRDLQNGKSLVEVFTPFPHVFGPAWVALMRRAMEDGGLGRTLLALAELHERSHHMKARVRAACTYPLVVFAISLLGVLAAFLFVLPPLLASLGDGSRPIPLATQALVFCMNVGLHPLVLVGLPLIGIVNVVALRRFLRTERGRLRVDLFLLGLPVVGPIVRKIAVARLLHALQAGLASGVRLTLALELAGAACGSSAYFLHALRCVGGLRDGETLSALLAASPHLYDSVVAYSVRIGEECGELARMIESLARIYDLEVSNALNDLLTSLEPVLVLVTGLLIGFVAVSIFLPLYAAMAGT